VLGRIHIQQMLEWQLLPGLFTFAGRPIVFGHDQQTRRVEEQVGLGPDRDDVGVLGDRPERLVEIRPLASEDRRVLAQVGPFLMRIAVACVVIGRDDVDGIERKTVASHACSLRQPYLHPFGRESMERRLAG
jgi:hypothetical protein